MSSYNSRKRRSNTGQGRSVVDYDTEDQLRNALLAVEHPSAATQAMLTEIIGGCPVQKVARLGEKRDVEPIEALDWVLANYDPETTEVQSMKEELTRLQVLKSYLILDEDREEAFERITALASRIFDAPIVLVSLVDLGRQWWMSNRGLGDDRETPRKYAFCAHAILSKDNMLVVPDATLDFRFRENPLVTGPPHIRFYAGAPLVSPEGYKLGTFCIIDAAPRPNGLDAVQRANLRDLADMTTKVMVDRRSHLHHENPAELIAYTAHDLMTPLTGVLLSLSLLKEDEVVKTALDERQMELLNTASSCSDLMVRICQTAIDGLRLTQQSERTDLAALDANIFTATPKGGATPMGSLHITAIEDLVKSLHVLMHPIPKEVPCIITVAINVPPMIMGDDLKLFRSSLNLLTNAVHRTSTGTVHFTIRADLEARQLLFECEDTGDDIPVEEHECLFRPSRTEAGNFRIGLSSVAALVDSMDGGEFGFRPRGVAEDGSFAYDSKGRRLSGSVFWFSIPMLIPNPSEHQQMQALTAFSSLNVGAAAGVCKRNSCEDMIAEFAVQDSNNNLSNMMINDTKPPVKTNVAAPQAASVAGADVPHPAIRQKRALVIEDSTVVRKSLARALSKQSYSVSEAVDGMEGFEQLKDTMFDIVLCDFLMPRMDGIDCAKQYRDWEKQNRPWFSQLIVGISAHVHINDSGQGISAGMNDFRPKPISIKTLTDLLESEGVKSRSRRLDELEGNASPACMVISGPAHDLQKIVLPIEPTQIGPTQVPNSEPAVEPVCLIATDTHAMQSNQALHELQSRGWKVVVVHDGTDALRLLQMRNWDTVLLDDDLPKLSGSACIEAFREWEQLNRVNGQKNLLLVCEGDIPSPADKCSLIQPPNGCNGVLRKPISWADLQYLLRKGGSNSGLDIVVRRSHSPTRSYPM